MASVTEPGVLRLYAVTPQNQEIEVASFRNGGPVSAGGSPDGVLANLTADKQLFQGIGGPTMTTGWKFRVKIILDAADGIDASDCVFSIPIISDDGVIRYLDATDLGFTTDLPAASPASVPLPLGDGYTIPSGTRYKFGGGPIVISVEDDTA